MSALIEEIAELYYMADNPALSWDRALGEDRDYYLRISDVVLDAVVSHLQSRNDQFGGAFTVSIEYLTAETDISRLRRTPA